MPSSRTNEWLQIIASVGVILSLLIVAYEIRQSNRIAVAESVQGIFDDFQARTFVALETGILKVYVKSIEKPDELTSDEILELDNFLTAVISPYERWLRMHELGFAEYDGLGDLSQFVDYWFSSAFGRGWFDRQRGWLAPEIVATIERELANVPVRTVPPTIEQVRSSLE